MKPIKILIVILSVCFLFCIIVLAYLLGGSHEILCPVPCDVHCICDVSVDCCCPTETLASSETCLPSATYTQSSETIIPTATSTSVPKQTPIRPTPTVTDAPPTKTPVIPTATVSATAIPSQTLVSTATQLPTATLELMFCHCEQGEGEGAEGRKNCHPTKYTHGHANHEWDYWSTDGKCDGWNH